MKQLVFVLIWLVQLAAVCAAEMSPFAIPLEMAASSPLLRTFTPLTAADRLTAREHFYTADGRRVRLWGVNLSFEACFPTHEDAAKLARRMAEFGVNSVRFHHMDTAAWPRGIWAGDGETLHPEALDRLDYFVDQLAKRGIYSNLNLHVGRVHSQGLGLPQAEESYDKMVSIFMPALIDAQKRYARALLTRTNPYRGMKYAEDYAVAIAEITNENSLFMWSAERVLPTLPGVYAEALRGQYNAWLNERYDTADKLVQAWTKDSTPLGEQMLKNADFAAFAAGRAAPAEWVLEQHSGCRATLQKEDFNGKRALAIRPQQISGTDWHLQFNQRTLRVEAGRVYTIQLEAAAREACVVNVAVGQAHEPWDNLGLWKPVTLTEQWQTLTLTFTASATDDNARVSIAFGGSETPFALRLISLRPGVAYALEEGESLEAGTIKVFAGVESPARAIDRMVFLAETEKAFFDGMRGYIKNDLGYKGMVTGTVVFGPLGLYGQSGMDFIDSHAYWQHPRFPRRSWDPGDWVIEQKAMSDYPEQGTLFEMAAERLAGKPFTVTEYNHPAPLDSQAECVPMIAAFAAMQDWDGVWLYTYSHTNNAWDRQYLNSYFDIDTNPSKWGFMPAGASVFRDGVLPPHKPSMAGLNVESADKAAGLHLKHGRNMLAAIGTTVRQQMMRMGEQVAANGYLQWDVVGGKGLYAAGSDLCRVMTGHTERFSSLTDGFTVRIGSPAFAAVTVVSLDGKPLGTECRRMLITACGRCENTGMQFSDDRSTVGRNWGNAPVQIETVEGVIQFAADSPFGGPGVVCKPLNPDGSVRQTMVVTGGRIPLTIDAGTMWYLVERN
ncbi:MAG: hypothetical protein GXY41_06925 [Phycisphaerae bacterium]|nr:hypothetical protein [Phycisphaerae bacterium]